MTSRTAARMGWIACIILVFVSSFFLSGRRQSPLELDPSWHAAIEYATAHHFQYGTQVVFTFGPLGFLSTRTSLGHLVGARIAFAFFWSTVIALAAEGLAKRLPGWVRYAFLAWLVVFTLSEGIDQTAFFVMACGAVLMLIDEPRQRWQTPLFVFAFVILALIKTSFLAAALASLALIAVCWIVQRKIIPAMALALSAPAGFVACWMALGQSPSHLVPWFRHALELTSGYSGAMSLVPKTPVLGTAVAALALFVCAFIATAFRAGSGIVTWGILITIVEYVFVAWKEGFTRSGDWHAFVFLWFLPLGLAFCFLENLSVPPTAPRRWVFCVGFASSMVLCVVAANFQIHGFARRQVTDYPRRVTRNAEMIFASLSGRSGELYADCRDSEKSEMLVLNRAQDVIGNESVDVMNYLSLAPVVNGMNYLPRPVFQGFVAYTPALQDLNAAYFKSETRPRFVLLSHEATDSRFPMLEDSTALNYVLNNYVPVARDGRFLVLQQRTAGDLSFQVVHEESLHFGEKLDLRPWVHKPLFVSAGITPSLLGRAAALLYQQHPLLMRVAEGQAEERFRIIPSMARRPFLVNPLLNSNFDVMNFYAARPGKEVASLAFERPGSAAFEFQDQVDVRLYTATAFPRAASQVPASRMIADVQGRVFWPEPQSVESAVPTRVMLFHGSPALAVRSPSKIVFKIPDGASSFTGYFGTPENALPGNHDVPEVTVSITITGQSGQVRSGLEHTLRFISHADHRISFRIPIDASRDRSITLTTRSGASGPQEGGWSVWSQCRFEESRAQ